MPVDHTFELHFRITFFDCVFQLHYFDRTISIAFSIMLHVKLTLQACECMQVPFNIWAYLSVQFKPQEK